MNRQFTRTGILFVLSAPSGAGKTTLCVALRQTPDFVYSVSCTTRLPRAGEIEGDDYHFVSEKDFLARVEAGDFLEHANVHGRYYGTTREPLISNLQNGVLSSGGNSLVRIFNSSIFANATGVASAAGGVVRSYNNNAINGNAVDGTPITPEPLN